ncbi:hypothetical protein MKX01_035518 [Papaver californicum]|nr:hypothetical protein MKX01_035518 [Papaver californicum]
MEHLQLFECRGFPHVLSRLFRSSVKENKEIAKEYIRLFLVDPKKNSGFFLPRSIQNQCATIVLSFCVAFYRTTNDEERQPTYFGIARTSQLIGDLYKILDEIYKKLRDSLVSTYLLPSPLEPSELRSLKRNFYEFELFSLHIRSAIADHMRVKGRSLPLNRDDFKKYDDPYYLNDIHMFRLVFSIFAGENRAMPELFRGSYCYLGRRRFPLGIGCLIWHSKKGDDHLWLLKYENALDFDSRRILKAMVFLELKDDDHRNPHKMLIDMSLLLTESFEHMALVEPWSLQNGLFVEFKDEVAAGHGVLRESFLLVCEALFSPEYSLFVECPEDHCRFFPNPAQVMSQRLKLFAFCGRVIALALMHEVKLGIAFDRTYDVQIQSCIRAAKNILEMDADLLDSDVMGLTFVREIEEFGSRKTVELCSGGINIVVCWICLESNREQYVHLLIQHIFVKSISAKVAYFKRVFGDILCKGRLAKNFFQGTELKGLDCLLRGSDKPICLKDWKAHTKYEDYREDDEKICWFWKREFLFFWTSVKHLPVDGFSALPYPLTIYKTSSSHDHLLSSHTCFNRLSLPHYPSLAITQQRHSFICQKHVGCSFGFV